MAEENVKNNATVETKDRGIFDFMKKDDHDGEKKPQEAEVIASEFDQKVQVSEPVHEEKKKEEEEKKPGLLEKLRRSDSSSSSSSEEEVEDENGEKIKRKKEKKGMKEKIKDKMSGEKSEEEKKKQEEHEKKHDEEDTHVPVEVVHAEAAPSDEKKGFLDKIKDKLPGVKKEDAVSSVEETHPETTVVSGQEEGKEKKGFLDKIKEKLPGYHAKSEEDKETKDSKGSH